MPSALYLSMDQCLQGLFSLVNDPSADVRKLIGKEISPVVITVVSCLVPILTNPETLNKSLTENSAITLGRLSWVCPDIVAPHMEHFIQAWCNALCMIRDDFEKEDAFHGLCAMVAANPTGAVSSLSYICQACASWTEIKSEG